MEWLAELVQLETIARFLMACCLFFEPAAPGGSGMSAISKCNSVSIRSRRPAKQGVWDAML
ncbi:hypothetical protein GCM10007207_07070 [Asaia siamensis]|uniref:Uncharacterized protein n=1 Tax=Asaia siamensis TaxID=110479 RepID=A0ABQ1LIQ9_9PROT|nr:hypothetical protein AA0323_0708 [Asaia siamensis NRIC 0323]GGC24411.1 hypothetical protein GCM10007207_07070 [Asaia siamensis]